MADSQKYADWADELFHLCQRRQGKAYISDGIDETDIGRAEVVRIAQQTLDLQRDLNRDLAKWIRQKRKELSHEQSG